MTCIPHYCGHGAANGRQQAEKWENCDQTLPAEFSRSDYRRLTVGLNAALSVRPLARRRAFVGRYVITLGVMKGGITVTSMAGPITTVLVMNRTSDIGVFFFLNVPLPSTIEGLTIAHGALHSGLSGGGITIRNSSPT